MKTSNTSNITRQACEWVAKLHETRLSESEESELKAWMSISPEHKAEVKRIAQQWDQLNDLTVLAVPTSQQPAANQRRSFAPAKIGYSLAAFTALAAMMILTVNITGWGHKAPVEQHIAKEVVSYSTEIGEQRSITLPDNSTVLLNTNSSFNIAYSEGFRDIYLVQGEAHFDVQTNKQRPFRVFAGKSQVRAVGTAFSVYLKKTTVDITVTHGSVAVDSISDPLIGGAFKSISEKPVKEESLIVKAGHSAEFNQLVGSVETKALPNESIIPAWHDGKLKFSGEPLNQFVEEISRYSPVSIVILDSELSDLRIGGLFDVGETNKMLDALEIGFGINVEYINERLVHLSAKKEKKAQLK